MKNSELPDMVNLSGRAYGDMIREYRKRKGMNQEQLGMLAGVKKNAVGAWEAGRSRPDLSSIPALCKALDMPLLDFFGVEDEKCRDENEYKELINKYILLDDYNKRVIMRQMDVLYDLQEKPVSKKYGYIRLFRNDLSAAAGISYEVGETSGEMIYVVADELTKAADEIIRVSGNSMEPTFYDGDQVFVQHTNCLREGEIGIFVNGNTGYIKEYRKDGLYSHNKQYPVMKFNEEDNVRCVGRVLGILKPEQCISI